MGHDARVKGIAQENVSVGSQAEYAFLYARSTGIVQPHHRTSGLGRQVHNLADLLADHFGNRAAEYGEVLGESKYLPSLNSAVSGHHGIPQNLAVGQSEISGPVGNEAIDLFESTVIHQQRQALPGS